MTENSHAPAINLVPAAEASKTLLGYFVHTWFNNYLVVINNNFGRLLDLGLIRGLGEPTSQGRYSLPFDFRALDLEKVSYINGIYFYLLAAHKNANAMLMRRMDARQVLFLRGYDFEGSISLGDGMAMGYSSLDTMGFTRKLSQLLFQEFSLFKVMSPRDVYWETSDAMRMFNDDFDKIIVRSRNLMFSVYLNALHWQQGVLHLLDRMDHYIVYVSSITESVLWELEQLDTDERRERVTVVFDVSAIDNKDQQLGWRNLVRDRYSDQVLWTKQSPALTWTKQTLRDYLRERFLVTSPEDFERDIEKHRERIQKSKSALPPGQRETWLEFAFGPVLEDAERQVLRNFSNLVEKYIADWTGDRGIDCMPLFFNLIQLRIFMTLLFGEHADTGKTLAAYEAVMESLLKFMAQPDSLAFISESQHDTLRTTVENHAGLAHHLAWTFLSSGNSHQFEDLRTDAREIIDTVFRQTQAAADHFFDTLLSGKISTRES